jgi:putative Mg2+ transporter-C (MgtC) family protein
LPAAALPRKIGASFPRVEVRVLDPTLEIAARLSLSVVAGAAIGLNRDLHNKPAGVRTHALVSLGTALAVLVVQPPGEGAELHVDSLSRVIQGVVTGIGFLGAGVILRDSTSRHVRGLTTAAAIWFAAILGVASGSGRYGIVVGGLALGLVVMLLGGPFERWFRRNEPSDTHGPPPAT